MFTVTLAASSQNSRRRCTYEDTFADRMKFFDDGQAVLGHAPPVYWRSTTAVAFLGQRPRRELSARAATPHNEVRLFV